MRCLGFSEMFLIDVTRGPEGASLKISSGVNRLLHVLKVSYWTLVLVSTGYYRS